MIKRLKSAIAGTAAALTLAVAATPALAELPSWSYHYRGVPSQFQCMDIADRVIRTYSRFGDAVFIRDHETDSAIELELSRVGPQPVDGVALFICSDTQLTIMVFGDQFDELSRVRDDLRDLYIEFE